MNKSFLATVLFGLLVSSPVWAETPASSYTPEDDRALCERYAKEDGVTPNQMADYMKQCLRDLAEPAAGEYGADLPEENATEGNPDTVPEVDLEAPRG